MINLFSGKIAMLMATIKDKRSTIYGLYLHQIEVYNMITSSIEKWKFVSSNGHRWIEGKGLKFTNFLTEFHNGSVHKCVVILTSN